MVLGPVAGVKVGQGAQKTTTKGADGFGIPSGAGGKAGMGEPGMGEAVRTNGERQGRQQEPTGRALDGPGEAGEPQSPSLAENLWAGEDR